MVKEVFSDKVCCSIQQYFCQQTTRLKRTASFWSLLVRIKSLLLQFPCSPLCSNMFSSPLRSWTASEHIWTHHRTLNLCMACLSVIVFQIYFPIWELQKQLRECSSSRDMGIFWDKDLTEECISIHAIFTVIAHSFAWKRDNKVSSVWPAIKTKK